MECVEEDDDGHMDDFHRFGRITASLVSAIIRTKDETRSRKWAWRCITGREPPNKPWIDAQRGLDHEKDAIKHLEWFLGSKSLKGRFVCHPSLDWLGASPDGFFVESIAEEEVKIPIEVKCPRELHKVVPDKYYAQIQTQLECCDAQYSYFCSWVMEEDGKEKVFIDKVLRDKKWWDTNFKVLKEFNDEYLVKDIEPPVSKKRST